MESTQLKLYQMYSQGVTDLAKFPIRCGIAACSENNKKKDENVVGIQLFFNNIGYFRK